MKRRVSAAGLILLVQFTACREKNLSRQTDNAAAGHFLSFARDQEGLLESALREFDVASDRNDVDGCREAARRALEAARLARNALENHPVPECLVPARGEELIFLNHVIPGFQAFLSGETGVGEIAKVRQILSRGRSHQASARAWLNAAAEKKS